MFTSVLQPIFERDLRLLRREVEAYPDGAELWAQPAGVANSAGTLVLHLCGNLQHFFGTGLAGTSYRRDREAEFSRRDVPQTELLQQIDAAEAAVRAGFERLTESRLAEDFPEPVGGCRIPIGDLLGHLLAHLLFHLGQIDYHRRMVTGTPISLQPVKTAELPSARPVKA